MVRSKSAKRFERLAHTVMILVTICIVLPFILLFMSSITSESALVRDGYSFFPKEFSIHAYKFIWDNAANVFRTSDECHECYADSYILCNQYSGCTF